MALEEILDRKFSRRDFLKGSMAATAAVAGLGAVSRESRLGGRKVDCSSLLA